MVILFYNTQLELDNTIPFKISIDFQELFALGLDSKSNISIQLGLYLSNFLLKNPFKPSKKGLKGFIEKSIIINYASTVFTACLNAVLILST